MCKVIVETFTCCGARYELRTPLVLDVSEDENGMSVECPEWRIPYLCGGSREDLWRKVRSELSELWYAFTMAQGAEVVDPEFSAKLRSAARRVG